MECMSMHLSYIQISKHPKCTKTCLMFTSMGAAMFVLTTMANLTTVASFAKVAKVAKWLVTVNSTETGSGRSMFHRSEGNNLINGCQTSIPNFLTCFGNFTIPIWNLNLSILCSQHPLPRPPFLQLPRKRHYLSDQHIITPWSSKYSPWF